MKIVIITCIISTMVQFSFYCVSMIMITMMDLVTCQVAVPSNDLCMNAQTLSVGSTSNVLVDTTLATKETNLPVDVDADYCVNGGSSIYRGVWFNFTGNGKSLFARSCVGSRNFYDDVYITVFQGGCTSSSSLRCVTPRKRGCDRERVIFDTIVGSSYHLLLETYNPGIHDISIDVVPIISNDACNRAKSIAIGSPMTVNTTYATSKYEELFALGNCTNEPYYSYFSLPGVWYNFTGNGERLIARSCQLKYSIISIFQGGCDQSLSSIQCITRKYGCEKIENAIFDTIPGVPYQILLETSEEGIADLSINIAPKVSNDVCNNAQPVAIGSTVTVNATYATAERNLIDIESCFVNVFGGYPMYLSGVWFNITGTGERIVVEACGYSFPLITIFQGGCNPLLSTLHCAAPRQYGCKGERNILPVFDSLPGTPYYIFLEPTNEGTAELTVASAPKNDVCVNSQSIAIGSTVTVNTTYATTDIELGVDKCVDNVLGQYERKPGVWFRFTGTGERLVARSCTDYWSYITIFKGACNPSSSSLQCVTTRKYSCRRERIMLDSILGVDYYILLESGDRKSIDLAVFVAPTGLPLNDVCINAAPIAIGSSVIVNTSYATPDIYLYGSGNCIDGEYLYPGVWFNFTGTGERLAAESCQHRIYITVFQGGCNPSQSSLQCTTQREEGACGRERIIFDTVLGVPYHILLEDRSNDDDTVALSIYVLPTVHNDRCINAQQIAIGAEVDVNFKFATPDVELLGLGNCIDDSQYPGVWFKFTGNGKQLIARSCSSSSTFITVFQGGCNHSLSSLQCIAPRSRACGYERIVFDTVAGVSYHLFFEANFELSTELSVFIAPPTGNDICINALPITIGSTVHVDTRNATDDKGLFGLGNCIDSSYGVNSLLPGVWFNFSGTGERLAARSCRNSETYITIFHGECSPTLSSLQCTTTRKLACDRERIVFDTISGDSYHLLLETKNVHEEIIDLIVFVVPKVRNDICIESQQVTIGSSVEVNATYATTDIELFGFENCISVSNITNKLHPGVWFNFTGSGERLAVVSKDAYITVFEGGCNPSLLSLKCVTDRFDATSGESLAFDTVSDRMYHVLIETLDETATMTLITPPDNERCSNAQHITIGSNVQVNTTFATFDLDLLYFWGTCYVFDKSIFPGVWFKFTGSGDRLVARSCRASETFVTIFRGECTLLLSSLQCVAPRQNGCGNTGIEFDTILGVSYHLYVEANYFDVAELTISLVGPTKAPVISPTKSPSLLPTNVPTKIPIKNPTKDPSFTPTLKPIRGQTNVPLTVSNPTSIPIKMPTKVPVHKATADPTKSPTTSNPTKAPKTNPIIVPTKIPTKVPTKLPTTKLTNTPTRIPTKVPTKTPEKNPINLPSKVPITTPTMYPTKAPTKVPTKSPTKVPTKVPTTVPTKVPTKSSQEPPIKIPTKDPTMAPILPTKAPTQNPTMHPTKTPSKKPTMFPTKVPTNDPTIVPFYKPTNVPQTTTTTTIPTQAPSQTTFFNTIINFFLRIFRFLFGRN